MLENVVVAIRHGEVGRNMFSFKASLFGRRVEVSEGDESTVCVERRDVAKSAQ